MRSSQEQGRNGYNLKERIQSFYKIHPVFFILLFTAALWIAINIVGSILLAILGMNRLPEQIARSFILLYAVIISIWLGMKSFSLCKLNQNTEERTRQILWGIFGTMCLVFALILIISLLAAPHT